MGPAACGTPKVPEEMNQRISGHGLEGGFGMRLHDIELTLPSRPFTRP
jgi:hypothetical protein